MGGGGVGGGWWLNFPTSVTTPTQATNTTKLRVFTKRLRLRLIELRFFLVGGLFIRRDPDAPRANGANLENPKNPDFAGGLLLLVGELSYLLWNNLA